MAFGNPHDQGLAGPADAPGVLSPEDLTRRRFSTSFRGFDQHEVREFLNQVADELARLRARHDELRLELESAAQAPAPRMDRDSLMAALGEETARIVRTAEEAAGDIRAKAEEAAGRLRAEAGEEAQTMRSEAAELLDRRRAEAETEVSARLQQAEAEAQQILGDAAWRAQEMIREAETTRDEVLADLAERRRIAHAQVERLGAGRDRLLEAYRAVRHNLDEAVSTLDHAPEEARRAAESAESTARLARPPAPPRAVEPQPAVVAPEPQPAVAAPAPEPMVAAPEPAPEPEPTLTAPEPEPEPETPEFEPAVVAPEPEPQPEPAAPEPEPAAPEPEAVEARPDPSPSTQSEAAEAAGGVFARLRAEQSEPATDHLEVRDAQLDPVISPLVRKLKRTLQDEQNDVLDRIRSSKGLPSLDQALGSDEEQARRYEAVISEPLEEAARAGRSAAGGKGRRIPATLESIRAGLAFELARPVRKGVGRALKASAGADDQQAVADGVGAAYREWRSARLENLATEHLAAAYVAGVYDAAKGALTWVVDDGGDPCPDCEDNALAGPTPRGEPFPTGQLLPPAHPGCRCLLVQDASARPRD